MDRISVALKFMHGVYCSVVLDVLSNAQSPINNQADGILEIEVGYQTSGMF